MNTDWLLPAPGFLEELTEHPSAPASAVATYALSPALLAPPPGASCAAAFIGGAVTDAIGARCQELFRGRAGRLYRRGAAEPVPLSSIESAARLQEELLAGAVWSDDPAGSRKLLCELREWPAAAGMPRRAAWTASWDAPVLPPLAAKLYTRNPTCAKRPRGTAYENAPIRHGNRPGPLHGLRRLHGGVRGGE